MEIKFFKDSKEIPLRKIKENLTDESFMLLKEKLFETHKEYPMKKIELEFEGEMLEVIFLSRFLN